MSGLTPRSAKRRKVETPNNKSTTPSANISTQTLSARTRSLRKSGPRTYGSKKTRNPELDTAAAQLGLDDSALSQDAAAENQLLNSLNHAVPTAEAAVEDVHLQTPSKRRVGRPRGSKTQREVNGVLKEASSAANEDRLDSEEMEDELASGRSITRSGRSRSGRPIRSNARNTISTTEEPEVEDTIMVDADKSTGEQEEEVLSPVPNSRRPQRKTSVLFKTAEMLRANRTPSKTLNQDKTPQPTPLKAGPTTATPTKMAKLTQSTLNTPLSVSGTGRKRGRPPKSAVKVSTSRNDKELVHFDDIRTTPRKSKATSPQAIIVSSEERDAVPEPLALNPNRSTRKKQFEELSHGEREGEREEQSIICVEPKKVQHSGPFAKLEELLQQQQYKALLPLLQRDILERLTGKKRISLVGLEDTHRKVYQLLEQTVVAGEGNSMLVIGARGTAKSTLVETVLAQLSSQHGSHFHVIRLNGVIHTDDKLALKEIWRQLGKEMEVEDDTLGGRNDYADTLASLLALLSHPAELSQAEEATDQTSKSVIFIMDNFELFASHPRQTLLYNLFDVAQSRKAPIAVLGLTTKVDVVESLEKRVKSRFSHRYVHLIHAKSFPAFLEICKAGLLCDVSENTTTISSTQLDMEKNNKDYTTLRKAWSDYMSYLLTSETLLKSLLRRIFFRTKSVSSVLSMAILPISIFSPTHIPTVEDFLTNAILPPDSKLHILPSLSELELSLLIAATRLDVILNTDICNFNMVYEEYTALANRLKLQTSASGATAIGGGARLWGKEVAAGAWEALEDLELIISVTGKAGGDAGRGGRLFKVDVALEEIPRSGVEMSGVMGRWCREI